MFPGCGAAPSARLRASSTRYGGAPLIRDRSRLGICDDPGSAAHHFVLRCARETGHFSAQLPLSDPINGKNTSCQDAGAVLSSPVLTMKAASFISPVGATEKTMEPSV